MYDQFNNNLKKRKRKKNLPHHHQKKNGAAIVSYYSILIFLKSDFKGFILIVKFTTHIGAGNLGQCRALA
jgi:hypothetical protein